MQLATDRPWYAILCLAVLCALSLAGALRIGVNADSSRMLSQNLPDQRRAAELGQAFPDLKRAIVIVVRSNQSDAADIVVTRIVGMLDGAEAIAGVFSPVADPFLQSHGLLYRKLEDVDLALTRLSASSNLLAKLRADQTVPGFVSALDEARALAARAQLGPDSLDRLFAEAARVIRGQVDGAPRSFGWNAILADDSEASRITRLITVTPELDLTRLSPAKPALETIRAVISNLPEEMLATVEIGVTGEPALRAEEMQSVLGTIGLSLTLSLILVAVILWIGLRSAGRAALAFASLIVTLILTAGFTGFAIGDLNLVSVAFVVLMVGLGIDFAIHILAHITELRRHGTPPEAVISLTGQRMGVALVLSAVTTSLAFLAFGTTDFAGMAQLGLIGGVGVLLACAVAMTLIPAVIALRPALAGQAVTSEPAGKTRSFNLGTALAPALIAILAVAAIWPALSARFEADPMGLRNPASESVRAFNLLARTPEASPYRASILAPDATEAAEIADKFANQEGIGSAIWLQDLVPADQDDKLELLDVAYPSIEFAITGTAPQLLQPAQQDVEPVAAFLDALRDQNASQPTDGSRALEAALADYLPIRSAETDAELGNALFQSFDLLMQRLSAMLEADYVDTESLPVEMRERFVNPDGIYRVEVLPEADLRDPVALRDFADRVASIEARAAGGPIQLAAAGDAVGFAILQATLLAALATGFLAWVATRSVLDALAILGPLVIAGILTAAASTVLNMPFNYANVIVLPLMIGIGVDSGIHIALRERRAPGAVFETSTPRAVVFSALTTVAAFGTLALSDHPGTASMGVLLAVSMCAAVACVMALTPTVIRWTRLRR